MPQPYALFKDEVAKSDRCPYCGFNYVLWWKVVYYREFTVRCCSTCGLALSRHLRWTGEARRKAAVIRLQRAQAATTEAT